LTKDYGKGPSHRNLEYFIKFFASCNHRISQTLSAKSVRPESVKKGKDKERISQTLSAFSRHFPLSWSCYIPLMKIGNQAEQRFYETLSRVRKKLKEDVVLLVTTANYTGHHCWPWRCAGFFSKKIRLHEPNL